MSVLAGVLLLMLSGVLLLIQRSRHHWQQQRLATAPPDTPVASLVLPASVPAFQADFSHHIAIIDALLPADTLQALAIQAQQSLTADASWIPAHKQGHTISYDRLREHLPELTAFYHSVWLAQTLRQVTGLTLQPTPLHDQSSCSLLVYRDPGDHIGWHYDHNFYRGRHFTVLLSLVNLKLDHPEQLSSVELQYKLNEQTHTAATPANTLVVFEGNRLLHRATRLQHRELRILLSMTFCTDPRASLWQENARRLKDIAFFGVKALWR